MTEETIASPAAEPSVAPEPTVDHQPSPPDHGGESIDRAAEPTAKNAIDRAFAAVEALEEPVKTEPTQKAEPAPEAKTAPEGEQPRGPDGKFVAKDGQEPVQGAEGEQKQDKPPEEPAEGNTAFSEAPSRFSADAKAIWKDAPDPVKAEVHRMQRELEGGIQQYKDQLSEYEPIREYSELAKQHGTSVKDALDRYTNLEKQLKSEPGTGIKAVLDYVGITPHEYASHVLGKTPDQATTAQQQEISALKHEIAGLRQELSGVSTTINTQQEQAQTTEIMQAVDTFAKDPANPRYAELEETIAQYLTEGRATSLPDAYALAVAHNPAAPAPAALAATPDPKAQTQKGSLSVTGAPGPGSNPVHRAPPKDVRDALNRSFDQVGL